MTRCVIALLALAGLSCSPKPAPEAFNQAQLQKILNRIPEETSISAPDLVIATSKPTVYVDEFENQTLSLVLFCQQPEFSDVQTLKGHTIELEGQILSAQPPYTYLRPPFFGASTATATGNIVTGTLPVTAADVLSVSVDYTAAMSPTGEWELNEFRLPSGAVIRKRKDGKWRLQDRDFKDGLTQRDRDMLLETVQGGSDVALGRNPNVKLRLIFESAESVEATGAGPSITGTVKSKMGEATFQARWRGVRWVVEAAALK